MFGLILINNITPSPLFDSTPLRQNLAELIQLQVHYGIAFRHDLGYCGQLYSPALSNAYEVG
jgi:hypothetical protein